jgi:hypothetical protein
VELRDYLCKDLKEKILAEKFGEKKKKVYICGVNQNG